jgi:hypothetical protein
MKGLHDMKLSYFKEIYDMKGSIEERIPRFENSRTSYMKGTLMPKDSSRKGLTTCHERKMLYKKR